MIIGASGATKHLLSAKGNIEPALMLANVTRE